MREIVRKYADYVRWPIRMEVERTTGEGVAKTEKEWLTLNQARAIWTRSRTTSKTRLPGVLQVDVARLEPAAGVDPLQGRGRPRADRPAVLPEKAPFDLTDRSKSGVKLFVKRVFIMDDAQEIVPEWLRFVRGVVDSEDLPLNVSREILQKDATTRFIKKQVVGKTLTLLEELAAEGETEREVEGSEEKQTVNRYEQFYGEFSRNLKEGVYHEHDARERLAKLLRFHTTHGDDGAMTGFADYVSRMGDEQKSIYYVAADSLPAAQASPHIEALKKHGHEVLLMTESIDEWVVDALREFDGKQLVSAAKARWSCPRRRGQEEGSDQGARARARARPEGARRPRQRRARRRPPDRLARVPRDRRGRHERAPRRCCAKPGDVPEQKRILKLNAEHAVVQKLQGLEDEGRFAGDPAALRPSAARGGLAADRSRSVQRRLTDLMSGSDMTELTPDQLVERLHWRYAVKKFDADKKVPADVWGALEQSLLLAPSSFGLQPWKFLVVEDRELRQQLRDASWGQARVTDADRYVVLTALRRPPTTTSTATCSTSATCAAAGRRSGLPRRDRRLPD